MIPAISLVQEYKILYTSQLTQKLKSWHDGKLRYYRINNKIEIFSIAGVLVKTGFIKNERVLSSSGEDVLLDGLLVSVDELLGSYEREIVVRSQKHSSQSFRSPITNDDKSLGCMLDGGQRQRPSGLRRNVSESVVSSGSRLHPSVHSAVAGLKTSKSTNDNLVAGFRSPGIVRSLDTPLIGRFDKGKRSRHELNFPAVKLEQEQKSISVKSERQTRGIASGSANKTSNSASMNPMPVKLSYNVELNVKNTPSRSISSNSRAVSLVRTQSAHALKSGLKSPAVTQQDFDTRTRTPFEIEEQFLRMITQTSKKIKSTISSKPIIRQTPRIPIFSTNKFEQLNSENDYFTNDSPEVCGMPQTFKDSQYYQVCAPVNYDESAEHQGFNEYIQEEVSDFDDDAVVSESASHSVTGKICRGSYSNNSMNLNSCETPIIKRDKRSQHLTGNLAANSPHEYKPNTTILIPAISPNHSTETNATKFLSNTSDATKSIQLSAKYKLLNDENRTDNPNSPPIKGEKITLSEENKEARIRELLKHKVSTNTPKMQSKSKVKRRRKIDVNLNDITSVYNLSDLEEEEEFEQKLESFQIPSIPSDEEETFSQLAKQILIEQNFSNVDAPASPGTGSGKSIKKLLNETICSVSEPHQISPTKGGNSRKRTATDITVKQEVKSKIENLVKNLDHVLPEKTEGFAIHKDISSKSSTIKRNANLQKRAIRTTSDSTKKRRQLCSSSVNTNTSTKSKTACPPINFDDYFSSDFSDFSDCSDEDKNKNRRSTQTKTKTYNYGSKTTGLDISRKLLDNTII